MPADVGSASLLDSIGHGPPSKAPATYEDLLALPEHLVGEIVDGELYASPDRASCTQVPPRRWERSSGPPSSVAGADRAAG